MILVGQNVSEYECCLKRKRAQQQYVCYEAYTVVYN